MEPAEGLPNCDRATVGLLADAASAAAVDEPGVPVGFDRTGEVLRLDHQNPARPNDNVVDVAWVAGKDHVVEQKVVVRQATKQFHDCGFTSDAFGDPAKRPMGLRYGGRGRDCKRDSGQRMQASRKRHDSGRSRTRNEHAGCTGLLPSTGQVLATDTKNYGDLGQPKRR